ncbi:MAG: nucleotidyltransferase family protein [Haloferacaceae archaeon]
MTESTASEMEALIECTDPGKPPTKAGDCLRSLPTDGTDWERVVALGAAHGVTPLLSRRLGAAGDRDGDDRWAPDAMVEKLRDRVRSSTMRTLKYADELLKIVRAFESAGIRSLPFKGPVLAAFSYGDVHLREFGDLDLLVHREDVPAAVDVLEGLDYAWKESTPRVDDSALLGGPFTMPVVDEYQLHRDWSTVELRWRVGDKDRPFHPDFETLWERRSSVDVTGASVPALDPIDRLLVLAFHGTKHRWHLLKWIRDFAGTLERTRIAWGKLFQRARTNRLERKLLVGIALATSLWDVDVPKIAERNLRADGRARSLADAIESDLRAGRTTRPGTIERLRCSLEASDSVRESLRSVAGYGPIHPSYPEYRMLPLSGKWHPIYYLLRPVRLVAETAFGTIER